MEKLSYKLPSFEGPLDLLLYLLSKHKLDICDIPIAELLEQYMMHMEEMKQQDTKKTDTKGTTTGKTVKKVKTGDTFSWIWIVTMVGALVVIGVVGYFIKRKRK